MFERPNIQGFLNGLNENRLSKFEAVLVLQWVATPL